MLRSGRSNAKAIRLNLFTGLGRTLVLKHPRRGERARQVFARLGFALDTDNHNLEKTNSTVRRLTSTI